MYNNIIINMFTPRAHDQMLREDLRVAAVFTEARGYRWSEKHYIAWPTETRVIVVGS